jgi:two-component system, OmpR family, phosphate regulon response regulator PhoB
MATTRVLVVEDEQAIREMLRMALERAGLTLVEARSADEAVSKASDPLPDLMLIDWMLPSTSGIALARRFKQDSLTKHIPIIMLTARGEEDDKVMGFEAGVDDYITKPFSPRELVARIRAVLRRAAPMSRDEMLEVEGLRLDPVAYRATADEAPLELGPTEFRLLHFFMAHPERVYTRAQLLDHVWGTNVFVEERTVDVHIRRLRKAIEHSGYDRFIQTVRGAGYRFSVQ